MNTAVERKTVQRLVLVTGPSGAGRSTALRVLEDAGYESIDNLPMSLLNDLFSNAPARKPVAIGIDIRNRDFCPEDFLSLIHMLRARPDVSLSVLYLDCRPDVLVQRFSETRRRHPLEVDVTLLEGIEKEIEILVAIKAGSDYLVDTSDLTPHDLRHEISMHFSETSPDAQLAVTVLSFSYKRGLPRQADMVFDCRFLRNPHWDPSLRDATGLTKTVQDYVDNDPGFEPFFQHVVALLTSLLPAYVSEGKTYLTIAFGCTGGQHRSVTLAERVGKTLADSDWRVSIRHRELERQAGRVPDVSSKVGFT